MRLSIPYRIRQGCFGVVGGLAGGLLERYVVNAGNLVVSIVLISVFAAIGIFSERIWNWCRHWFRQLLGGTFSLESRIALAFILVLSLSGSRDWWLVHPVNTNVALPVGAMQGSQTPRSPCLFYDVTIHTLEVVECPSNKCEGELIYQFYAHNKRFDDTILTQSNGVTELNLVIQNIVFKGDELAVKLNIKTILGETMGRMRESWEYTTQWGKGERRFVDQTGYMTYIVIYEIECRD